MASKAYPACRAAQNDILSCRYEEEDRPDGTTMSFFPLDRLRRYLQDEKTKEILECKCPNCTEDRRAFGKPDTIQPVKYLKDIVGDKNTRKDIHKTAFGLFSLLIYLQHPILILGFLDEENNDYWLEMSPGNFRKADLKRYTGEFATNNKASFDRFAIDFVKYMPEFAVRHMDSGKFSKYPPGTILPFVNEKEIGVQKDEEGQWTNIGANGRVFSFEIYEEYRRFPHARDVTKFARKTLETTSFTKHLERANLGNAQIYNDKHIVKLIKAYSLGGVMNLIFPLAKTNLDHLLRNPDYGYAHARGGQLESCNAFEQLLGIANGLSRIAGIPDNVGESTMYQWRGFHLDLKPANILVSDDGTWLITDFGESHFTYTNDRTPRVNSNGGTDAYAPPEILDEDKQFSRRYDVWSLGCIALEVTAFVVLGYPGLTGSPEHEGLDHVRCSHDGWSKLTSDSRFWYRKGPKAVPEVKPQIITFIAFLKESVRNLDQRSQQFIGDILKLIERMLKPMVENRIDIGEVIRILNASITQASSLDDGGKPLQTVAAPGERDIGAPELGQVKLWHWNRASRIWQFSALRVFEDLNGNLRFYTLADNRLPSELYLRRHKDAILPHYAYWKYERPQATEKWLAFTSVDPAGVSEVPGAIYAFDSLEDARFVQSRLTYQRIEMSFPLQSIKVKQYVKLARKARDKFVSVFNSRSRHAGELEEKLYEGKDLGPATIQLWTEEVDKVAAERREKSSMSSGAMSTTKKPRLQSHQQAGYRDICPRRAVIYLHNYGSILIVRTNVNWIARVENDHILQFQPTDPGNDAHFVSSLIQPTSTDDSVAGLPLCPQVLRRLESETQFEADKFILQFAIAGAPNQFNTQYRSMKRAWEIEKEEVEKQQRFNPFHIPPDWNPDPLTPPLPSKRQSKPANIEEYYAPETKIKNGKGRDNGTNAAHSANIFNGTNGMNGIMGIDGMSGMQNAELLKRHTTMNGVPVRPRPPGRGRGAPPKGWPSKNL